MDLSDKLLLFISTMRTYVLNYLCLSYVISGDKALNTLTLAMFIMNAA